MVQQAERAASPRRAAHAAHSGLRHLRDAGVPAPVARFRRRGEGRRQAGRADRRRRLQSLRIARDARQPLWSDRARHARADATCRNKENDNEPGRQGAGRAKGPLVWLDMDQKALDDAYDQIVYAPNRDQVHKRNMFNSDRVRARLGAPKRLAYGSKPIEQLDLFPTIKPNAPINVFIHGGAWRHARREGLRVPRRDHRARRRALGRPRLRRRRRHQRRSAADGRSGAARRRLGLQERQELRRRSEPHLCLRPVVRRASCRAAS